MNSNKFHNSGWEKYIVISVGRLFVDSNPHFIIIILWQSSRPGSIQKRDKSVVDLHQTVLVIHVIILMEKDIIVEGFLEAEGRHGLHYNEFAGDGDSSTYVGILGNINSNYLLNLIIN